MVMHNARILFLFSNFRKTGPAEPMLNLCAALQARGWDIRAAFSRPLPWNEDDLTDIAAGMGIKVVRGFNLRKHFSLLDNAQDVRLLTRYLREAGIDLIHAHMDNDHLIAALAAKRSSRRVLIVRSHYDSEPSADLRRPIMYDSSIGAVIFFSEKTAREAVRAYGLSPHQATVVEGAVDLCRFDPDRGLDGIRRELGLGEEHCVAGIVARIQAHRRFGLLLEAFRRALTEVPNLRLTIVGRGGSAETVAIKPAEHMGIREKIVFTGHRPADDYVRILKSIDFKIYLVPGSDGTCRAVREAMAMGRPIIATRRGMLEEIVEDGKTGILVDESPEALASAMLRLARDPDLRHRLGQAAREKALAKYSLDEQAKRVEAVYERLLGARPQTVAR